MIKLAIIIVSFICFSSVSFSSHAAVSNSRVINGLLKDIKVAQKKLVTSQNKLAKVRSTLARKLRAQEQKVIKLRNQAEVSQRLQDEKTLSLQQLQARLKSWNEQNQYQQNILSRFNHNISKQPFSPKVPAAEKLAWLSEHLVTINHKIAPTWQTKRIVMPTGKLQSAKILALGPVTWYVDNEAKNAGFISQIESDDTSADNLYKAELTLSTQDSAGLIELMNTGTGMISFDPTLTRAFKINSQQESIIDHVGKGGIWIFPILFFGVFALIIALAKTIQFIRLPKLIPAFNERFAQLEKITKADDKAAAIQSLLAQAKGMQAQLVEIARHCEIGQIRDDRLFANLLGNKHKLDYWLGAIAITAAVSPLLGLLGTVSGMIETFKLMTLFGAGDPAAVSGGISQALVTTELGLVVAIPALLLHALLTRRVKTYYGELESCGVNLSQLAIEK
ncbi:MAG: MotA/TolQ/ExbB proton channel family protein [Gammaproteobacteria bacterium]|nr:MotA/TolQ/ExbB proton channel family protein [Gammaproteobacteria bacterium]